MSVVGEMAGVFYRTRCGGGLAVLEIGNWKLEIGNWRMAQMVVSCGDGELDETARGQVWD